MSPPDAREAQEALRDHIVAKAIAARALHNPLDTLAALEQMLADRSVVRYPLGIRFDAEPLQPGEFACLEPLGEHPADGFCLFVHPRFATDLNTLPLLVAYYIPNVNYGDVVTHVEAELFGAHFSGIDREVYYQRLCEIADSM